MIASPPTDMTSVSQGCCKASVTGMAPPPPAGVTNKKISHSLPPPSSLLSNHPLLFILLLMAFASSHFSVLCFNPLVAASSGGSTSSRGSPYNLTVSAVSSKAATVQWELTSQYLSPIHSPGGNYSGTGGSSMEEPKLIKSFQMILKPTFPPLGGSGDDSDSDNSKSGGTKPLSHSSSGNFLINVTLDGTKRFYTFKGLQSRTEYQVYIVAKGEDGSGNVSETVIFTTIEGRFSSFHYLSLKNSIVYTVSD